MNIYGDAVTRQNDVKLGIPLPREHLTEEGPGQAWVGCWRAPSPLKMSAGATGFIKTRSLPLPLPPRTPSPPHPCLQRKHCRNTKVHTARNGGKWINTSEFRELEINVLNQELAPCFHNTELSIQTSQEGEWGRTIWLTRSGVRQTPASTKAPLSCLFCSGVGGASLKQEVGSRNTSSFSIYWW